MSILIKDMQMPKRCAECKVWSMCWDEKPAYNMIKSICKLTEVEVVAQEEAIVPINMIGGYLRRTK